MAVSLSPVPRFRALDANANPLAGGWLYTFLSQTSTPHTTWTDYTGLVANTNPVQLDANGEADVWLDSTTYRFRLESALGVVQYTIDGVSGIGAGGGIATGAAISKVTGTATAVNNDLQAVIVPALIIPAGVLVLGVLAQVTTTFGSGNGLTSLHLGDGGIVDRWFSNMSPVAGAVLKSMLPLDSGAGGLNLVLTAAGGAFDATGVLAVSVYYLSVTI